mgnify:CR=1 FL=1
MKSLIFFGLIYLVIIPLIAIGCDTSSTTLLPPTNTVTVENKTIDITLEEFTADSNITENIEISSGNSLIVELGSNPTTGYEWEEAVISDTNVISQDSHGFFAPENKGMVGSGGTDTWTFSALKAGTATITFSYGRPWEGGEKGTYTLTVNVTVK